MTILEAVERSGLSAYTLNEYARKGEFEADMPRGKRFGRTIDRESFELWLLRRRMKTGNSPARARARRELLSRGVSV